METKTNKNQGSICSICEIRKKVFTSKSYLKLHDKTVHAKVEENICDICSKNFDLLIKSQLH